MNMKTKLGIATALAVACSALFSGGQTTNILTFSGPTRWTTNTLPEQIKISLRAAAMMGYQIGKAGGTTNDLNDVFLRIDSGDTNALNKWLTDKNVIKISR